MIILATTVKILFLRMAFALQSKKLSFSIVIGLDPI